MRSLSLGAAALGAALAVSAPDDAAAQQPPLALSRYNPSSAGDRFFTVSSPYAGEHLVPHAELIADYAHNPLVVVVETPDGREDAGNIVEHQLFLHVNATFGIFERLSLNIDLPVALFQAGDNPSVQGVSFTSPDAAAFGDLRIGLRGRLFGDYYDPVQIGIGGYFWVPTGSGDSGSFTGTGYVRGRPELYVGGIYDRFVWTTSLGSEFKSTESFGQQPQGHMFQVGAAGGILLGEDRDIQVGPEFTFGFVYEDIDSGGINGEGLLGARVRFADFMVVGGGVGTGFTAGIGTPDARAALSIAYSPKVKPPVPDSDGDGLTDDIDRCPKVPGPERTNGCPDRDKDGIIDKLDACADDPGQPSEDPKKHGCPDKDGDGILDNADACVDVKGIPNEDPKKHGCPPPGDKDGDGIKDDVDACIDVPGVANPDAAKHGCPSDKDGDGIIDKNDACIDVPGVKTADPKTNGCPPDTDKDGIIDAKDACPKIPGRKHKDPKKHGCPLVVVKDKEVLILERVEFETARARIRKVSFPLLDRVAKVLNDHPELVIVEVQGHTDNKGSKFGNKGLSKRRARSVRNALIKRGVKPKRLKSQGFGQDKPIATNDTAEGRQQNRRVEFKILKRDKSLRKKKNTEVVPDKAPKKAPKKGAAKKAPAKKAPAKKK